MTAWELPINVSAGQASATQSSCAQWGTASGLASSPGAKWPIVFFTSSVRVP